MKVSKKPASSMSGHGNLLVVVYTYREHGYRAHHLGLES
jgi:hypothetical protein